MDPMGIINQGIREDDDHLVRENGRRSRNLHRRRSSAVAQIEGELFDEQAKNIQLQERNRELTEQLQKSKALAKMALIESAGLAATIGHLHKVWKSGKEMSLDEVKAVAHEKVGIKATDPKTIEEVEKKIASIGDSARNTRPKI